MSFKLNENFFLVQPFQTDDLKAEVEALRAHLLSLDEAQRAKDFALRAVYVDLDAMEAKADYVDALLERTFDMFTPPPKGDLEAIFETLSKYVYEPVELAGLTAGAVGTVALSLNWLGPKTVSAVGRIGRAARLGSAGGRISAGAAASGLAKTARLAKAGRVTKLARFGRFAVKLSGALLVVDLALRLKDAAKINESLRAARAELEQALREAEPVLREYDVAIKVATDERDALLREAGAADVDAYLQHLNAQIAVLARGTAELAMARKLLRHDTPQDVILSVVPGLTADALGDLAVRLAAERAAARGETATLEAGYGLDPGQAAALLRQQDIRDAFVTGEPDAEIRERFGLAPDSLDMIEETVETALLPHWHALEGDAPLDPISDAALVRATALDALRGELQAKAAAATGKDEGDADAAAFERARAEASARLAAVPTMDRARLAVDHRLPLSVAAALAA